MKAAVSERYGPPEIVEICDVQKPAPAAGEVLVKIAASTVSRTDRESLRAHPFFARLATGLFKPKITILGMDFAGIVEAVAEGVTRFKPGDRVFGMSPEKYGCHAEYACFDQNACIALLPEGLDFHQAVVCEGAWYANCTLEKFGLQAGHSILIYGASGAIGTAAVQLAKAQGARVTAVVGTRHTDLAKSLGADRVIDYQSEDFTAVGESFDLVFDAVGKTTYGKCRGLLKPGAPFASTDLGPYGQNIGFILWGAVTRSQKVFIAFPTGSVALVAKVRELLANGRFRAVIDSHFPLERIVEAYRLVASEQKTGIVVIDVTDGRDIAPDVEAGA